MRAKKPKPFYEPLTIFSTIIGINKFFVTTFRVPDHLVVFLRRNSSYCPTLTLLSSVERLILQTSKKYQSFFLGGRRSAQIMHSLKATLMQAGPIVVSRRTASRKTADAVA